MCKLTVHVVFVRRAAVYVNKCVGVCVSMFKCDRSKPGVLNTSIAIYQSISKVLLVDRMTIRFDPVCLFPQLGCYVFSSSVKRPEVTLS